MLNGESEDKILFRIKRPYITLAKAFQHTGKLAAEHGEPLGNTLKFSILPHLENLKTELAKQRGVYGF